MRIASAAAIFASWTKPWRTIKAADRRTRLLLIGLGACLAIMITSFYLALDRLPMSLVAAMEFAIHKLTAPEAPVQELASTVP
jgi:inner membrane transporter RhtA